MDNRKEKLSESILRLHKRKGTLYIPDIEAEVINFTCLDLLQNNKTEIFDHMNYAQIYSNIAKELFKEYDDSHCAAAQMSVIQNMEWPGMRDFLKEYYQKNHGISISL
ncbi:MAG: hypothetical protein JNM51_00065 [Bacteroidia bacterium]|nr:hypothetical protein [Bacteroidia bacterium]